MLDRSGKPHKAATIRSYEQAVRAYIEPALGSLKLHEVGRQAVQRLVDELRADGLKASTVHNKLDPLRVLYRRLVHDGLVTIDPTDGLRLPAVRGRRERVASPAGAALDAHRLRQRDHPGQRGWNDGAGDQEVKTNAGRRTVPLAGVLRRELAAHKLRTGRAGDDLVFGRSPTLPFTPSTVRR